MTIRETAKELRIFAGLFSDKYDDNVEQAIVALEQCARTLDEIADRMNIGKTKD